MDNYNLKRFIPPPSRFFFCIFHICFFVSFQLVSSSASLPLTCFLHHFCLRSHSSCGSLPVYCLLNAIAEMARTSGAA